MKTLRPHFELSKTRLETLAVLLFGLANCRMVNFSHLWQVSFRGVPNMDQITGACSVSFSMCN